MKLGAEKKNQVVILGVLVAIILLVAIAAATVSFVASGRDSQSTNDAYTDGRAVSIAPRTKGGDR